MAARPLLPVQLNHGCIFVSRFGVRFQRGTRNTETNPSVLAPCDQLRRTAAKTDTTLVSESFSECISLNRVLLVLRKKGQSQNRV